MRMPPDHLARDRLDYIAERERVFLFSHAGMKHHLQQEVAEFLPEIIEVTAGDGVSNFIGLLDCVGRDRREILLKVPRATSAGRPKRRHDLEQARNIARRGHWATNSGKIRLICRKMRDNPAKPGQMPATSNDWPADR